MNGVAYKMTELELASFLKARGHRLVSARLDGNVVAFDFNGDAAPHVELRAPALDPRKEIRALPTRATRCHNSQLFLGSGAEAPGCWLCGSRHYKRQVTTPARFRTDDCGWQHGRDGTQLNLRPAES